MPSPYSGQASVAINNNINQNGTKINDNTNAITAEETARIAAVTAEETARIAAVTAEETARIAAISTNTSDIANNASNIATNTSNISTNTTAIQGKHPLTTVDTAPADNANNLITSKGVYDAIAGVGGGMSAYCQAHLGALQTLSSGAQTRLNMTVEDIDVGGIYDHSGQGEIKIPAGKAGDYMVTAKANLLSQNRAMIQVVGELYRVRSGSATRIDYERYETHDNSTGTDTNEDSGSKDDFNYFTIRLEALVSLQEGDAVYMTVRGDVLGGSVWVKAADNITKIIAMKLD